MIGRIPAVNPTTWALVCGVLTGFYAFKPLFTQRKVNSQVNLHENVTVNKSHNDK